MSETLKDIAFDLANRLAYANAKLDYVGLSGYDCIKQYSQDVEGVRKIYFYQLEQRIKAAEAEAKPSCNELQRVDATIGSSANSLRKTHSKSFFVGCEIDSPYANNRLFKEDGKYVVLQLGHISDKWLIFELVKKDEYEV